ncbi:hypothetical protein BT93_E2942 [Corymbia citriodora subsp. variegata]|nr:hypothetical protein BT93_E2942 [Corymbia citriodora subsp. variegata]
MIIRLHKLLGNRWSLIAGRLPGRTANHVKNYWNTHLAKNIIYNKLKEDNPPGKFTTKVNIIRPRPRVLSKNLALFGGKDALVALRTPPGENPGQPSPMLSRQYKESPWWENLLTDSGPDKGLVTLTSSSKGQPDGNSSPREFSTEERQNDWNELSFDADIWGLLGASPQAVM